MYHFARWRNPIIDSHWAPLERFFQLSNIEHDVIDLPDRASDAVNGVIISCSTGSEEALRDCGSHARHVQLQHNLSGLRGNPLDASKADLIVLAGRRVSELYNLPVDDERVFIGGYPKWDLIVRERGRGALRREALAAERHLDPSLPWICFYPTAPNFDLPRGNHRHGFSLSRRIEAELGSHEFFFINHGNNRLHANSRAAVEEFRLLSKGFPNLHLIDGGGALHFVSASDLFISDIASATFSAIAFDKPVVFLPVKTGKSKDLVHDFQCSQTIDQIDDLGSFLEDYQTPPALRELLASAIEYDDDKNCQRVTEIITGWAES